MPYYPKKKRAPRKSRKSRKGTKLPKKTAKAVKQIVQRQMNNVIETKIADYSFTPLGSLTSLYHNDWYRFEADPFNMYQGTSDSEALNPINRIGDSIYVKSINFTINLESYNTYSTLQYRFVVLKLKAGATMPINITAHPQAVNNLIAPIDREQPALVSVVMDKHGWLINHGQTSSGGGDGERQLIRVNIPINKKIKYNDGSAASGSWIYAPYILMFDRQTQLACRSVISNILGERTSQDA